MASLMRGVLPAALAVLTMVFTMASTIVFSSGSFAADEPPAGAAKRNPFESHDFDRPPGANATARSSKSTHPTSNISRSPG